MLWRDGLHSVPGSPEHSEDIAPLYTWHEERQTLLVKASTARGLSASDVRLEAGTNFVDCLVRGQPTPWCGVLVGRVDPARCIWACASRHVHMHILVGRVDPAGAPSPSGQPRILALTLALTLALALTLTLTLTQQVHPHRQASRGP